MVNLEIVSGGQTGVDLAALIAAEICGFPTSGWVPLKFTNETGENAIPQNLRKGLHETGSKASAERTELNVRDADGLLTVSQGEHGHSLVSKGTQYAITYALDIGKGRENFCFIDLDKPDQFDMVVEWVVTQGLKRCAVNGPRESEAPGIQERATLFFVTLLKHLKAREAAVDAGR